MSVCHGLARVIGQRMMISRIFLEKGCAVPLHEAGWKKARQHFEELMKKQGKKVGPAPKS